MKRKYFETSLSLLDLNLLVSILPDLAQIGLMLEHRKYEDVRMNKTGIFSSKIHKKAHEMMKRSSVDSIILEKTSLKT